jgi:hypothetical protein
LPQQLALSSWLGREIIYSSVNGINSLLIKDIECQSDECLAITHFCTKVIFFIEQVLCHLLYAGQGTEPLPYINDAYSIL